MADQLALWMTVSKSRTAVVLYIQHRGTGKHSRLALAFMRGAIVQDMVDRFHKETKIAKPAILEAYRRWWLGDTAKTFMPVFTQR